MINRENIYYFLIGIYMWAMVFTESQLAEIGSISFGLRILRIGICGFVGIYILSTKRAGNKNNWYIALLMVATVINFVLLNGGITILTMVFFLIASMNKSLVRIFKTTFLHLLLSQLVVFLLCEAGVLIDSLDIRTIDDFGHLRISGSYIRHSFGFLLH